MCPTHYTAVATATEALSHRDEAGSIKAFTHPPSPPAPHTQTHKEETTDPTVAGGGGWGGLREWASLRDGKIGCEIMGGVQTKRQR